MLISEISLWGTALIAILVFIASIVLFFIDRQMLRRMLAIMIMPMLYVGMLLGGVKPIPGLITLLLLIAVSFVANVLSGSIALSMIRKGKK